MALHHPGPRLLLLPDSDSGRGGEHGFEVIIYTTEIEMLIKGEGATETRRRLSQGFQNLHP